MNSPLERARSLLQKDELEVPDTVKATISFLASRNVWFNISRNKRATSCLEAAQRRSRLGKIGIPIWDEMKSAIYSVPSSTGDRIILAIHCRGDRTVQEESIRAFLSLNSEIERMPADLVEQKLSMGYGLVNPFSEILDEKVIHVFDDDLISMIGVPGTLMTNAGDYEWGVEFYVAELAGRLKRAEVAKVSEPDPKANRRIWGVRDQRQIAIITGNSPESGMLLWESVNECIRQFLGSSCAGDLSMPPVTVFSLPEMGLSMELEERTTATWEAVKGAVTRACVGGCKILALACNTTQYFRSEIEAICEKWGAQFISIPSALQEYAQANGINRARLFGIGPVTDFVAYSAFRKIDNLELFPASEEDVLRIEELGFAVKRGSEKSKNLQKLKSILGQQDTGREKSKKPLPSVIALTELSLILRDAGLWKQRFSPSHTFSDRLLIDTVPVYAIAIAAEYLEVSFFDILSVMEPKSKD